MRETLGSAVQPTEGRQTALILTTGRQKADDPPNVCKDYFRTMDTSRLLLAFLAFGAACTTLWAWMVASAGTPSSSGK